MNINSCFIKIPTYIIYYLAFHFLIQETYFICTPLYDNQMFDRLYEMCSVYKIDIANNVKSIYDFNIFGKFQILMEPWEIILGIILFHYYRM